MKKYVQEEFRVHPTIPVLALLMLLALASSPERTRADDLNLSQYYGFKPIEAFKLSERATNLLTGDLNHDGRTDLVVVDNSKSRINLLIQRTTDTASKEKKPGSSDVNAIEDHWRFELRKISVDQEVASVALGDFNGDGRTDIVYFGAPDQLVFRFQPEKGEWTQKKQQRVPDVAASQWFLAAGDLDGNGLDDLVILGKHETVLFYQPKKGVLAEPKKLMNTSDKLGLAQIADLDGDGRNDLCYLAGEGLSRTLGTRLQLPDGQLGPEYIFDLERPRAVSLRDIDGKPGQEILTIDSRTGRLKLLNVERRKPAEGELPERLIQFGFGKQGSGRDRDLTTGDLNGDGLLDVVVTDPDASRVLVFLQREGAGLDLGTPYPGLNGADQIRAGDFDADGKSELVVRSGPEKTLGISRFIEGRLSFPESLPVESETSAIEVIDFDHDKKPEIVFISKSKKDRSSEYSFQAIKRGGNGEWVPYKFGDKVAIPLELKATPDRLALADINDDERPELIVFQGTSKPPQFYSLGVDGTPTEIVISGNLGLGNVSPGAVSLATLGDRKGVLVAQDNFARHMILGPNKRWQVGEQFNAGEANSKIIAATVMELDGRPGPDIVLVDGGVKKLRVLHKAESTYTQWKEIDIGDFPFKSLRVADLNGDKRDDLLLFGMDKFAILYAGAAAPAVKELASFESQLEKIYPTVVIAGDLNGDGRVDLALTDTRSHFIEILQFRPEVGLKHALYFRVFEQKSFSKSEEDSGDAEPREALIADVTGDGLADLILLIHDRLLLYPQDSGK